MNWYAVYTKRKQEERAKTNLERQGFRCYLPMLSLQKISRGAVTAFREPLFPRYLFLQLDPAGEGGSWSTVRSTRGVTRLVAFGKEAAVIDARLVAALQAREAAQEEVPLFAQGEAVKITSGAFSGIEGIYLMPEGESRAMVLINLLQKGAQLQVGMGQLKKVGH